MSKVKIKLLKNVVTPTGTFKVGETYEVDEAFAKQLCTPVKYADRNELMVKAIIVEAHGKKQGVAEVPIENLTVHDMHQLGIKNIVPSEPDPAYDEYLREAGALKSEKNEKAKARFDKRQAAVTQD